MNETFFFFMGIFLSYLFCYIKERIEKGNKSNGRIFDFIVFQCLLGGFLAFWAYSYYFVKELFNG